MTNVKLTNAPDRPVREIFSDIDERVLPLLEHARSQGHNYIMFDGDGLILDGFPTFDW